MVKVVLDVYGADHSPLEIVKGAVEAVCEDAELFVYLAGNEAEIKQHLSSYTYNESQIGFIDASDVITNFDKPTEAIRTKKNSSLVKSLEFLSGNDDVGALVSAGSTGAVLAGGIFKVGRIKGVQRPALAPIMPTLSGGFTSVVDCGANIDCKPQFLSGFAVMGSVYMKALFDMSSPRVALLSNGVEAKKGNELVQESFKLIKELGNINFVGNMEAREALSGDYDVIVCDGFAGNVLIKSIEGTAKMFSKMLKEEIMASSSAKIGYIFMKKSMNNFRNRMDVDKYGGAPFLGLKKLVIKAHGSAKAKAIKASLHQAKRLIQNDLVGKITAEIALAQPEADVKDVQ